MTPCYIAAPYGAPTPEGIAWNIRRAEALGRVAALCGWAPLVVHSSAAGVYGDDADPATRERGLAGSLAMLRLVVGAEGHLWALLRDDGSMSAGVAVEVARYRAALLYPPLCFTWAGWRSYFEGHDLDKLWTSLEVTS